MGAIYTQLHALLLRAADPASPYWVRAGAHQRAVEMLAQAEVEATLRLIDGEQS